MTDSIEALIPPVLMLGAFIALLIVAFRATDGAGRRRKDDDG